MRDAVGEHARLPGAGAGDHEQRPFGVQDGLPLGGIQAREVLLGRGDGHPVDASGGVERPRPARTLCDHEVGKREALAEHALTDTGTRMS